MTISGSPFAARCVSFRVFNRSSDSRRVLPDTPSGLVRNRTRVALRPELHALVQRGQKPAAPTRFAAVRLILTRYQNHESRQILTLAAQPVGHPRCPCWAAR